MKQVTDIDREIDRHYHILAAITEERTRQIEKWGVQNHPDGTGYDYEYLSDVHRRLCDGRHKRGDGTWADILLEEVYEALAESGPAKLREELVQVAAVAATWIDCIDRRASDGRE